MKLPKMIFFDYGETLIHEEKFDGLKGTKELLKYVTHNKYGYSAEDIQKEVAILEQEIGRYDSHGNPQLQLEIPNTIFSACLYQSLGIEFSLTPQKMDSIFWDASAPGTPTDGIFDLLDFLKKQQIKTGVISNMSFCKEALQERIERLLPNHNFSLILTSSSCLFRKPHHRIFDLALELAGIPSEDVWYIGDNYVCDVLGAGNVGMFPVWYTGTNPTAAKPDQNTLTISHWDELYRYFN